MDEVNIFKSGYPEVRGISFDYLDMRWSLKPHSTAVWEMIYITRGEVKLEIGRKIFHGKPGDIFFIPPNVVHRDHFSLPDSYCAYIILFAWRGAEKSFKKITNRKLYKLSSTTRAKICDMVEQMWAEFKEQKSGFKQIIDMYLAQAFFLLAREFIFSKRTKSHPRLSNDITVRIKDYIKKNYDKPLSLESLAAHVGVSPFYLTHIFSQESGFSPHKYLTLARINQAKRLLGGKLIVKEVSSQVGFDDPNYFGKVFKKIVGVAPGQFRRSA